MGIQSLSPLEQLAVEHWRVLRQYERALALTPPGHHEKNAAQLRYARSRLSNILDGSGIRLMAYEGQAYSPNLPVAAINADEFEGAGNLQIEQTLEPTVLLNGEIRALGKVVLKKVEER